MPTAVSENLAQPSVFIFVDCDNSTKLLITLLPSNIYLSIYQYLMKWLVKIIKMACKDGL